MELRDRVPAPATSRQMTSQEWKQVGGIVQQDREPDGEEPESAVHLIPVPCNNYENYVQFFEGTHTVTITHSPVDPRLFEALQLAWG